MPQTKFDKIGDPPPTQNRNKRSKCYENQRSDTRDDLTRVYKKQDPSDPWGAIDNGPRKCKWPGPIRTRKLAAVLGSNFSKLSA